MIGDQYIVKEDCFDDLHGLLLKRGEILTESAGYNNTTEQLEDCPDGYNNLFHIEFGFICEVGSSFAKDHMKKA